jgi:hypothetical protein
MIQHVPIGLIAIAVMLLGWLQQAPPPAAGKPAAAQPAPAAKGDKPPFKQEELEQIVAPIALYPDDLLSQVLMASTYPIEIVQCDRWVKANKSLKKDQLPKVLEQQKWDPSVKSLVNFPDVLSMLSDKLDWTQKLGDAFIGQQKDVMTAVQKLRAKAKESGNLQSSKEIKVEEKQESGTQVIYIESSSPDVIYVPTYNPTVVYGTWPYPSYPPYYPYVTPYPVGAAALSFGIGVACGAAWGYAWGNCHWGGGEIEVDIDKNVNRNSEINRNNYQRDAQGQGATRGQGQAKGKWQHDASHRGNVPYRNQGDAKKFGGTSAGQAAQARQDYRGRGGADQLRAGTQPSNRAGAGSASNRAGSGGAGSRPSAGTGASGSRGGAFEGVSSGGRSASTSSQRGRSSQSSSGASSRGSGGARGGGGGRGGGGRGGGGRR